MRGKRAVYVTSAPTIEYLAPCFERDGTDGFWRVHQGRARQGCYRPFGRQAVVSSASSLRRAFPCPLSSASTAS